MQVLDYICAALIFVLLVLIVTYIWFNHKHPRF